VFEDPLAGRKDVVDVQSRAGLRCVLTRDHAVRCEGDDTRGQQIEIEDVDALLLTDSELCIAGPTLARCILGEGGGVEHSALVGSVELIADDGRGVCGRFADGRLVCEDIQGAGLVRLDDVADFATIRGTRYLVDDAGFVSTWFASDRLQRVAGLQDVVELVGGRAHVCARDRAGLVHCWGRDDLGQLGRGLLVGTDGTPRPVFGLERATALRAFGDTTCALLDARDRDDLRCWGAIDGRASPTLSRGRVPGGPPFTLPAPGACVSIDLDAWRDEVAHAQPGLPLSEALGRLRLFSGDGMWPRYVGAPLRDLAVHAVELDGVAPLERVIVGQFRSDLRSGLGSDGYTNHTALRVLVARDQTWCLVTGGEFLTSEVVGGPCPPRPEPDLDGARVGFHEILDRNQVAIEVRTQTAWCPWAADETLFLALGSTGLEPIFGPFATFFTCNFDLADFAEIELRGRFPRKIRTTSSVDCDRHDVEPPASDCTSFVERTWTFDGVRYMPDIPYHRRDPTPQR